MGYCFDAYNVQLYFFELHLNKFYILEHYMSIFFYELQFCMRILFIFVVKKLLIRGNARAFN
jgi:hypothetical protein